MLNLMLGDVAVLSKHGWRFGRSHKRQTLLLQMKNSIGFTRTVLVIDTFITQ
jgi:hypothetical protein